jgi:hypothetical protein
VAVATASETGWHNRLNGMNDERGYRLASAKRDDVFVHGRVRVRPEADRVVVDQEGNVVLQVPGASVAEFVPGRQEVAFVTRTLRENAESGGTARDDYRWFFERYSLPEGKRLSRCEVARRWIVGWPVAIVFAKKDKGRIARVRCRDEDGGYSCFIELSADGDREVGTPAERAGKVKAVVAKKRAVNLYTTPEELAALAAQSDALAAAVATNARTPADLLDTLASHPNVEVRSAVARHAALPKAARERLAADPEPAVRSALLNPDNAFWDAAAEKFVYRKRDRALADRSVEDPDPAVRTAAARATRDEGVLCRLARDPDVRVRMACIRWGIPVSVERILAADSSAKVRLKLAESRAPRKCGRAENIDGAALAFLLVDSSARVRAAAALLKPYGENGPPP